MRKYLLLTVLLPGGLAAQSDIDGSRDHPLLTRFPGSSIVQYSVHPYDEVLRLTERRGDLGRFEQVRSEGRVTRIAYSIPDGFDIAISCRDNQCATINQFASNLAEEGGARNRRVQLVAQ